MSELERCLGAMLKVLREIRDLQEKQVELLSMLVDADDDVEGDPE